MFTPERALRPAQNMAGQQQQQPWTQREATNTHFDLDDFDIDMEQDLRYFETLRHEQTGIFGAPFVTYTNDAFHPAPSVQLPYSTTQNTGWNEVYNSNSLYNGLATSDDFQVPDPFHGCGATSVPPRPIFSDSTGFPINVPLAESPQAATTSSTSFDEEVSTLFLGPAPQGIMDVNSQKIVDRKSVDYPTKSWSSRDMIHKFIDWDDMYHQLSDGTRKASDCRNVQFTGMDVVCMLAGDRAQGVQHLHYYVMRAYLKLPNLQKLSFAERVAPIAMFAEPMALDQILKERFGWKYVLSCSGPFEWLLTYWVPKGIDGHGKPWSVNITHFRALDAFEDARMKLGDLDRSLRVRVEDGHWYKFVRGFAQHRRPDEESRMQLSHVIACMLLGRDVLDRSRFGIDRDGQWVGQNTINRYTLFHGIEHAARCARRLDAVCKALDKAHSAATGFHSNAIASFTRTLTSLELSNSTTNIELVGRVFAMAESLFPALFDANRFEDGPYESQRRHVRDDSVQTGGYSDSASSAGTTQSPVSRQEEVEGHRDKKRRIYEHSKAEIRRREAVRKSRPLRKLAPLPSRLPSTLPNPPFVSTRVFRPATCEAPFFHERGIRHTEPASLNGAFVPPNTSIFSPAACEPPFLHERGIMHTEAPSLKGTFVPPNTSIYPQAPAQGVEPQFQQHRIGNIRPAFSMEPPMPNRPFPSVAETVRQITTWDQALNMVWEPWWD